MKKFILIVALTAITLTSCNWNPFTQEEIRPTAEKLEIPQIPYSKGPGGPPTILTPTTPPPKK